MAPIKVMDAARFDQMRLAGRMESERFYIVQDRDSAQVAWSPDGVGCYWYETLAEAMESH